MESGYFTSTGANVTIPLRSDVDWCLVYNETAAYQNAADLAFQFFWRKNMTQGRGTVWTIQGTQANDPITVAQIGAGLGFYYVDSSVFTATIGPAVITNISNATPPRVTSAGHGLVTGDIVTLQSTVGALQLDGIDFRVTRVDANNFDLTWGPTVATAAAPGAAAFFRKLSNEGIYVPRARVITKMTQAVQAVVTMAAPHNFTVGQKVRMIIPQVTAVAYGMTALDGQQVTVVAIDLVNNTITIDFDTTGLPAFAFPLTANVPFTPAQVVPIGEDTSVAISNNAPILGDATMNVAEIGLTLVGGATGPAGANADVIYWQVGKGFNFFTNANF